MDYWYRPLFFLNKVFQNAIAFNDFLVKIYYIEEIHLIVFSVEKILKI